MQNFNPSRDGGKGILGMVTRRGFIGACSLAAAGFGLGGCKSPFGGVSSGSLAVNGIRVDANDWPAIFSVAAMAGTKWAVVECETRRDTYDDVAASISYLRNLNNA